jgi:hypothetical protein
MAASERDRPDGAWRRLQWMANQNRIDPRLVFIDGTWTWTPQCANYCPPVRPSTMPLAAASSSWRYTARTSTAHGVHFNPVRYLSEIQDLLMSEIQRKRLVVDTDIGNREAYAGAEERAKRDAIGYTAS